MIGRSYITAIGGDDRGLTRVRVAHLCLPWLWRSRVYWRRRVTLLDVTGIVRREIERGRAANAYVNIEWRTP